MDLLHTNSWLFLNTNEWHLCRTNRWPFLCEYAIVQVLVPEFAVETLYVRILLRLAWFDKGAVED